MLHLDALGVELEKLNKTQSDYLAKNRGAI